MPYNLVSTHESRYIWCLHCLKPHWGESPEFLFHRQFARESERKLIYSELERENNSDEDCIFSRTPRSPGA
jgi:hypothetical protein